MSHFEIGCLDHVGITVRDLDRSIAWYETVLGLKKCQLGKWGIRPTFMLSGKTGIALFSVNPNDEQPDALSPTINIDHFAFRVSPDNFSKARMRYEELDLTYQFKDHYYFHSIYTKDPDGHIVELTTLAVDESEVYV